MFRMLSRCQIILLLAISVKFAVMILITPWGDLINWSVGASNVLGYLSLGRYPPISVTGVYGPLQVVLAPFFWIWTQLPIDHPPLASLPLSKSTPAFALSLLMKLPSFIADLATGVLIRNLVRYTTSSERKSWIALLAWYCNPFNTYWIEAFGAVDVIPAAILLLAIMLDMKKKWFSSGLCVAIASILRIFPLFVFPFTLAKAKLTREYASLLSGFLLPLVGVMLAMYASGVGTLSVLASLPQNETWLLDFLGVNLSQYVKLTPVLMVLQFFIIKYYWTKGSIIQCVSVALLTLLVGALPYGGYGYHFLWVSPLLSISLSMNLDEIWVFIFTFVTASLYPPMIFVSLPSLSALEPLFAGAFFAAKATYLTKINVENVQILKIAEPARAVLKSASWSEGVN